MVIYAFSARLREDKPGGFALGENESLVMSKNTCSLDMEAVSP